MARPGAAAVCTPARPRLAHPSPQRQRCGGHGGQRVRRRGGRDASRLGPPPPGGPPAPGSGSGSTAHCQRQPGPRLSHSDSDSEPPGQTARLEVVCRRVRTHSGRRSDGPGDAGTRGTAPPGEAAADGGNGDSDSTGSHAGTILAPAAPPSQWRSRAQLTGRLSGDSGPGFRGPKSDESES
jgi:hypothetical protein